MLNTQSLLQEVKSKVARIVKKRVKAMVYRDKVTTKTKVNFNNVVHF